MTPAIETTAQDAEACGRHFPDEGDGIADKIWPVANLREYHADRTAVSHSAVDVLRDSPVKYHEMYVANTLTREPTKEMVIGTVLHALVFERMRFAALVAAEPDVDRRTKAGKAAAEYFANVSAGKTIIPSDDYDLCGNMLKCLQSNPLAWDLLTARGYNEAAFRAQDAETGILRKVCLDKIVPGHAIADLKTIGSLSRWARDANEYGYHRQQAWYMDVARDAIGFDGDFFFVVVQKEQPHECGIFQLDGEALCLGRKQNRAALNELKERMDSGNWESRYCDQVQITSLPTWAFY